MNSPSQSPLVESHIDIYKVNIGIHQDICRKTYSRNTVI